MRGCAELSWHAGANYILGLDERAHIQKAKQVCGFHVVVWGEAAWCMSPVIIHIAICPTGIKIYISVR